MNKKKKLLVSFSGGETSAFMAQWLWRHKQDEFDMAFVFANTGEENEETLIFVDKCEKHFGFPVVWVEAVVHYGKRKSSTHKIVNFQTASRNGEPLEEISKKYGIPNQSQPHCTRETKRNPIDSYAKSIWPGIKYHTAIGIREDEIDRINPEQRIKRNLYYPLIEKDCVPMTKKKINFYWSLQPFRLELKGYQGNCKTCWKKSNAKLYTIAKENPEFFDFNKRVEELHGKAGPLHRKDPTAPPNVFFRGNRSAEDILREAQKWNGEVVDDSLENEACEVFSNCGDYE